MKLSVFRVISIALFCFAIIYFFRQYFSQDTQGIPDENLLKGKVRIDGSSTVFPITEAVAEEFGKIHQKVRVTVGVSGTGGGFKKFILGETDINNASRPIKSREILDIKKAAIAYLELPIAFDGISIVVNPKNDWVDFLTVEELKQIWKPSSHVNTWKDIRPTWPAHKIKLYGSGTDSGTFDYFTKVINGKEGASRSDYSASEDDNVLVLGVSGDLGSLGYFGYAYYYENRNKLRIIPVKYEGQQITPSFETIRTGQYRPLSRPLFLYVRNEAIKRQEIFEFIQFYFKNAPKFVTEVGYIPLPQDRYDRSQEEIRKVREGM